ncbi:MAG: adenylyl-sulfate kinase [Flavobacteriales bacterium]|nr:adenylyl-sulfate kinase [Flavobacteriales bacterium]
MKTSNKHLFSSSKDLLSRTEKEKLLNQKGIVLWLTGLSGSGKTTLAKAVSEQLHNNGFLTQVLDGDNIRLGINSNLSFTLEDRMENIRRTAEMAKLFVDCGVVTICCLVSPTEKIRTLAKEIIGKKDFFEVFINTPLNICEERDVKGLYELARKGEVKNFTGISAPFENPKSPSLEIKTEGVNIATSTEEMMEAILPKISFNK